MKVIVDAFGGDNAPYEIIKGAIKALKKYDNLNIILCGDEVKIKSILEEKKYDENRIEIIHAPDVISNNESPAFAIKNKKESSLVVAYDHFKEDNDIIGFVSAGSTGAVLTGAALKIGRIKGISRPALAPFIPTKKKDHNVLLIDCGANMDCKPINLCHFAIMGSNYSKCMLGIKNPRVALLNVGAEDHKGNELCKQTFPLLKNLPINFVGNMEARDFLSGDYDVVVTDGFAGNVLLKGVESSFFAILSEIKYHIKKGFFSKIGAAFMMSVFSKLKKKFDYNKIGGSLFLGAKRIIIKSHGSSKASAICASIGQVVQLHKTKIISKIEKVLEEIDISDTTESNN